MEVSGKLHAPAALPHTYVANQIFPSIVPGQAVVRVRPQWCEVLTLTVVNMSAGRAEARLLLLRRQRSSSLNCITMLGV
jgi:hypothetical protein